MNIQHSAFYKSFTSLLFVQFIFRLPENIIYAIYIHFSGCLKKHYF
ncbi:MAG: hypothetical protein IJM09_04035 [Neisseriaceae bacterium]|nr:hypothetical protein [Neisseriaceae bacterium]